MSVFVGRSRELDALDMALTEASMGSGGCIVVSGDAGIGKSRLLRETQRRAREKGYAVLTGACEQPDRGVAFGGMATVLRDYLQSLKNVTAQAELGAHAARFARFLPELRKAVPQAAGSGAAEAEDDGATCTAIAEWLVQKAMYRPLLFTLEDIHWSDDASLMCLANILNRLHGLPFLMLLSFRTPLADRHLQQFLDELEAQCAVRRLPLKPLSRSEVALVMRNITGASEPVRFYFLAQVFDVTGGNPFFVEELSLTSRATDVVSQETDLQGLHPRPQAAIPRSIRRIIRQRLLKLSRPAQQIVDFCAVHGRKFDVHLLGELTAVSQERLMQLCQELVRAHLVFEPSPGQFAFRHALIRESIYDRLLIRERRTIHERLVIALEKVYAGSLEEHLADLSYHAYMAAYWHRALHYCRLAAEKAMAMDAPRAALLQLTRAIEAASWLADVPSWQLHCMRAQILQQLGDSNAALTDYATALDSARLLGDKTAEAVVRNDLAALLPSLRVASALKYYGQIVSQGETSEASPEIEASEAGGA